MDPQEFIDQLYIALLEQGWTLNDIDNMDIAYYLYLIRKKSESQMSYIDEVL